MNKIIIGLMTFASISVFATIEDDEKLKKFVLDQSDNIEVVHPIVKKIRISAKNLWCRSSATEDPDRGVCTVMFGYDSPKYGPGAAGQASLSISHVDEDSGKRKITAIPLSACE